MPSFDVISSIDLAEVDNALQQAKKELASRWDFRGVPVEMDYTQDKKALVIKTDGEEKIEVLWDVLLGKLVKRGIAPYSLTRGKKEPSGGKLFKQQIELIQGLPQEKAKKLIALLKDSKIKAQGSIQGDAVRVTAKDRDVLQEVIALYRGQADVLEIALQFTNRRD